MSAASEEVFVPATTVVEIDATVFAQIILDVCHTSKAKATEAANLILDHLIAVHRNATRKQ
jgi:hypothetical protein